MKLKPTLLITMLFIYLTFYNRTMLSANTKQDEIGKILLSFFRINKDRTYTTLPLDEKPTTLQTKDQLKIYYQPLTHVYFYIYHIDTAGTITLFFPENFNTNPMPGKDYYIPAGAPEENREGWITLQGKGPEVFYLIASTTRLQNLELYTKHYLKHRNGRQSKLYKQLKQLAFLSHSDADSKNLLETQHPDLDKISGVVKGFRFDIYEKTIRDIYVQKIIINH